MTNQEYYDFFPIFNRASYRLSTQNQITRSEAFDGLFLVSDIIELIYFAEVFGFDGAEGMVSFEQQQHNAFSEAIALHERIRVELTHCSEGRVTFSPVNGYRYRVVSVENSRDAILEKSSNDDELAVLKRNLPKSSLPIVPFENISRELILFLERDQFNQKFCYETY